MKAKISLAAMAVAAGGLLSAAPSIAQMPREAMSTAGGHHSIIVTAPRARQTGRTEFGAPIDTLTAQSVVYYDDLDLHTKAGRDALDHRIATAAKNACDWLDQVYPPQPKGTVLNDCTAGAIHRAEAQVDQLVGSS